MADLASSPYFLLILFIAAFALPLVYLVWIRNSPRYGREPWPTVLKTFAWGAVFSVIIAIILSVVFILLLGQIQSLNDFFARRFQDPTTALGALVVAPIVEEAAKGVGATAGRRQRRSSYREWGPPVRSSWSRSDPSRPLSSTQVRPRSWVTASPNPGYRVARGPSSHSTSSPWRCMRRSTSSRPWPTARPSRTIRPALRSPFWPL
ncbi:MAG: PrsW family intramembrane metalloprotease [Methanobacteriota archaeon]|nr:MAG: PrsW family intramembrane metalloprotease [Euryarchaeota archaeon]